MTREEAKKDFFNELLDITFNGNNKLKVGGTYRIIDKIYDDLESRTCDNCAYNLENSHEFSRGCTQIEIEPKDMRNGFGCNRFERSTDD